MSHRARLSPDRTVREEITILQRLGFEYLGTNAGGHLLFEHPVHGVLRPMSCTPRNPMTWRRAHRVEVARLMGMNLWQFERLLAGQAPTKRRRAKGKRPRSRKQPVAAVIARAEREAPASPEPDADVCTCGRRWLSDLNPVGRRCPACDGYVVAPERTAA